MARVKPAEPRVAQQDDLVNQAKQYAFLKSQLDYLEKQQKELRVKLFEMIDTDGEPDSKQEVDGYVAVTKQRRVTRKIDEEKAAEVIAEHELEDSLYKTIRVIDEDALMAALYDDTLTEEEVEEMYPQSVTWALVLSKK